MDLFWWTLGCVFFFFYSECQMYLSTCLSFSVARILKPHVMSNFNIFYGCLLVFLNDCWTPTRWGLDSGKGRLFLPSLSTLSFPSLVILNSVKYSVSCTSLINRKLSIFHLFMEHLFILLCGLFFLNFCLFIRILSLF